MIFLAAGLKISDLAVLEVSSLFDKTSSPFNSGSELFLASPPLEAVSYTHLTLPTKA